MTKLKLVATDMDGTFLNSQSNYGAESFAKVHQLMDQNDVRFVVASGNQYYQLRSFFEEYPETIYVSENGALITYQDEEYWSSSFDEDSYLKVIDLAEQIPDLELVVCGKNSAYVLKSISDELFEDINHYYFKLKRVSDFREVDDEVLKFASNCPDDVTEKLVDELTVGLSGVATPVSSGHGSIDIIKPGVNKATGLNKLSDILHIKPEEMCAFGDGGNDIEMLDYVGDGVAMNNATDDVKEIADHVTKSNDNNGVINYVQRLLNKEG
ncbi:Cof-type HAD-IIB family hydrolase [Companilactobacillus nodensis]|uniref:HAD superfamily hydrolase n=1 Tax=Companilactobacillus nodensis DSM 19682 = JCM 14932 = NBRC 107160 TaxID=1423775 RepID=A0A0R1K5L5_9LACO|nr:Cof-type HAD-IIB family hydrolase [Companilactobacillus nodensis]KRK78668.1 HAD superfamily hydrolase [Companilactobacillus nodensis DSM 19682 = JCM 14932 = NBRC 107160]